MTVYELSVAEKGAKWKESPADHASAPEALGASRLAVVRLVLRHSFGLVGTGLATAIAISVLAVRPLAIFLVPNVKAADPVNSSWWRRCSASWRCWRHCGTNRQHHRSSGEAADGRDLP